jgi:sugar lactone lactonase YvrE
MKIIIIALISNIFTFSLLAQQVFVSGNLEKKWEVSDGLKVPESVCYDATRQVLYISSISGSPMEKDKLGFISKISPDGKMISLNWVTGLNAPKGMGIMGKQLYVTDIDRVVEIDAETGTITQVIEFAGASFLNDISIDPKGNVYVSDSKSNALYAIKAGKVELLSDSEKLKGINGLNFSNGRLLAGLQDRIVSIDPGTKQISDYIMNTGSIDGLVPDGNGNFIISDWAGHVHLVSASKEKVKLLDTTPAKVNAADLEYIVGQKLLLVPTFNDNKVVAYEINGN